MCLDTWVIIQLTLARSLSEGPKQWIGFLQTNSLRSVRLPVRCVLVCFTAMGHCRDSVWVLQQPLCPLMSFALWESCQPGNGCFYITNECQTKEGYSFSWIILACLWCWSITTICGFNDDFFHLSAVIESVSYYVPLFRKNLGQGNQRRHLHRRQLLSILSRNFAPTKFSMTFKLFFFSFL